MARHRYVFLSIPVLIAALVLVALVVQPAARAAGPSPAGRRLPTRPLPTASAPASPASTCPPGISPSWRFLLTVNPDPYGDALYGVTAISPADVWAVGAQTDSSKTLTEHFNGFHWTAVSSPNAGYGSWLVAVSGVTDADVWAVGNYYDPKVNNDQTLIEHWNGVSWSIVPSPNPNGSYPDYLTGVVALTGTNVWAVGYDYGSQGWVTLIEHWDGSQWSVVSSPNPGSSQGGNSLYAVTATSATDVWAVGTYGNVSADNEPLTEHWNGTSWSVVSAPSPGGSVNSVQLDAISATSSTDIWAVGVYGTYSATQYTLIEHWNGSAWSIVPSPTPGSGTDGISLSGVAATSATDAWAGGSDSPAAGGTFPLLERWNGTSWSLAPSPTIGASFSQLNAISKVVGSQVMAVGAYTPSSSSPGLALSEYYAPLCLLGAGVSRPARDSITR